MGFFRTLWLWIKRLVFIACMVLVAMCVLSGAFDVNIEKNALSITLIVLCTILAVANCVLYFIFGQVAAWPTCLGIGVQAVALIMLGAGFGCEQAFMGLIFNLVALGVQIGLDGLMRLGDFFAGK